MADYYPLLSRAVAGLPADQPEARQAIYARAREAMERHLGSASPALEDADILKEKLALEDVIRRIEQETEERLQATSTPPAPQKSPASEQASLVEELPQNEPEDEASASAGSDDSETPSTPSDKIQFEGRRADDVPSSPIVVPLPPKSAARLKMPNGELQQASRRKLGILTVLGVVVLSAMGAMAYINREGPAKYRAAAVVQQTVEQPSDSSKREGRLAGGDAQAEATPTPQPPRPSTSQNTSSPTPPVQQQAPPATPALPIASRAFMVLEVQGGAPNQYEGQANWTFAPDASGKPESRTLRATVEFAAAGLNVDFSLAENKDASLNASHTIFVAFEPRTGLPDVRAMSAIEWRERENQSGITFAGVLVPVQDNMFMIGLDKSDFARKRNLDLLRNQKWMVFEFALSNNRRGAMLIEKGSSGERAITEALALWQ